MRGDTTSKVDFILNQLDDIAHLRVLIPWEPGDPCFPCHQVLKSPLPSMVSLTLMFTEENLGVLDDSVFKCHTPRLRHLSLMNVRGAFSPQVFRDLSCLRIHYAGFGEEDLFAEQLRISDVFQLLRQSPQLEFFQLSRRGKDPSMNLSGAHYPVEAKSLQTLILDSWELMGIRLLFMTVELPSLRRLKVTAMPLLDDGIEEDLNILSYLDDAPAGVRNALFAGQHLTCMVKYPTGVIFSLGSERDVGVATYPLVVLQGREPPEDHAIHDEDDYVPWEQGISHTIEGLGRYLSLPQLRTLACEFGDDMPSASSWRILLQACVCLEEIDIAARNLPTELLQALTPSAEHPVLCPALHTLTIRLPLTLEASDLSTVLRQRRITGYRLPVLKFIHHHWKNNGEEEFEQTKRKLQILSMEVEVVEHLVLDLSNITSAERWGRSVLEGEELIEELW